MVALTTHANEGFIFGQIAQLVEHEPEELGVLGSIPSLSIYNISLLNDKRTDSLTVER